MAVAIDAVGNSGVQESQTSFPISLTVGTGSQRHLLVGVGWYSGSGANISSVTWSVGSQSLTAAGAVLGQGGTWRAQHWGLVNPNSGSGTITVTFGGTDNWGGAGATATTGVDQTTPLSAVVNFSSGSTSTPSLNVSATTDDLVADVLMEAGFDTPTPSGAQTGRWNLPSGGGNLTSNGSTQPGATTTTMSWTTGFAMAVAQQGVAIKAAAAPSTPTTTGIQEPLMLTRLQQPSQGGVYF